MTLQRNNLHPFATKKQQGFTLIELIVVIVILGILAANAMPKYMDIRTNARIAVVNGTLGGINSAKTLAQSAYYLEAAKRSGTLDGYMLTLTLSDNTPLTVADKTYGSYASWSGYGNAAGFPVAHAQGIGAIMGCQRRTGSVTVPPSGWNKVSLDIYTCQGLSALLDSEANLQASPPSIGDSYFFPPGVPISASSNCYVRYDAITLQAQAIVSGC